MTESELVNRCKKGDRSAQKELYERTISRTYSLSLRITRNEQAAFDVTQNSYIRAFRHIGQFDGKSAFATWLYRVAYNEALQFLKSEARRTRFETSLQQASAEIRDCGDADARMDVDEALSTLTPDERMVLMLRYHEGLDYRRMAQVLDCAPGTVASRLNRARAQLRTILEKSYEVSEES